MFLSVLEFDMIVRAVSMLGSVKDERSVSFDVFTVQQSESVDPLQPNITYREPYISGYHSRCSSARSYVFGSDELSQVEKFNFSFIVNKAIT